MPSIRDPNSPVAGQITWEGDLVPPVTSYSASLRASPMMTSLQVPASTNRYRSAVVDRHRRLTGLRFWYAHGAVWMSNTNPRPASNGVQSTAFQRFWVNLFDWTQNLSWYSAGYPRNTGLTFRMPQPETNKTGGPSDGRMQPAPVFTRVQRVPRYSAVPRSYPTTSSNG